MACSGEARFWPRPQEAAEAAGDKSQYIGMYTICTPSVHHPYTICTRSVHDAYTMDNRRQRACAKPVLLEGKHRTRAEVVVAWAGMAEPRAYNEDGR